MLNKALDFWLPAWRRREKPGPHALGVRHVMIAVCDQFEPAQGSDRFSALARVTRWRREFPQFISEFRDADGAAPKHTFFSSVERDQPEVVQSLAELCAETGCEVEIHRRHEKTPIAQFRQALEKSVEQLASHHLLARDQNGTLRYGFLHGNDTLDEAHPQGQRHKANEELSVLRQTGCYGDFTLPAAPDRAQSSPLNALYYARSAEQPKDRTRRVSADRDARVERDDELLVVQGPLTLNWRRKKFGIFPRIENAVLTATNPPNAERLRLWLDCKIAVEGRPNWLFIKLHTQGARPENTSMLLGEPMRAFHRTVAQMAASDRSIRFHYVTAREMVNILHAAEAGHSGEPGQFRDFRYRSAAAPEPARSVAASGH